MTSIPTGISSDAYRPQYKYQDLDERVSYLSSYISGGGKICLSNQYGMVLLLNSEGEIVLNLSAIVSAEERMKHS